MPADPLLLAEALSRVNEDRLVQTTCDLINIPSPTGSERAVAEHLIGRYQRLGMRVIPQQIEETRHNGIGILEGDHTGPTLMFCGHMDTSYVGNEAYLPDIPSYKPRAFVEDGWIYGLGAYNMKPALAAYLEAAEVVRSLGAKLKGDVTVACVCGEIEKSPVDQYQGALYRGGGIGAWYAVTHGAVADFAVIGEQSSLGILRAHGGYVYTKITLVGGPAHSIFNKKSRNTIHNMMKVVHAIEEWGDEYAQRASYLGMPAGVTTSAIEGGWPYRCSRVPVYCSLYVDTRLMPNQSPLQVQREIQATVDRLIASDPDLQQLRCEVSIYMSQYGSECATDEPIFRAVRDAHLSVFGTEPEVFQEPFYTDATELVRHGIPTLNYGPGGRTRRPALGGISGWDPLAGEQQSIEDLVNCTKVYVSLILDLCSKSRAELGIRP